MLSSSGGLAISGPCVLGLLKNPLRAQLQFAHLSTTGFSFGIWLGFCALQHCIRTFPFMHSLNATVLITYLPFTLTIVSLGSTFYVICNK